MSELFNKFQKNYRKNDEFDFEMYNISKSNCEIENRQDHKCYAIFKKMNFN